VKAEEAECYFRDLLDATRKYCEDGKPLPFVIGAAFIDYFSKMVAGEDNKGSGYKDFIKKYLGKIRPAYANFTYKNGKQDLHDQMWHVLRCGIVHSFSLIPDKSRLSQPGRNRSIALMHKKQADAEGWKHLCNYLGPQKLNAALFVAEDFIDDLIEVNKLILSKAQADPCLKRNIEKWLNKHPPIKGGY